MTEAALKDGDVFQYNTKGQNWCRHGIAVMRSTESGRLIKDTYWGINDATDYGVLRREDIGEVVVIGNIHDFETSQYIYDAEDFADEDRFHLPMGGGSAQTWVRKGAKRSPELVGQRLRYQMEKAWHEIEYAIRRFDRAADEYIRHECGN
jgi:hypothetical protein